MSGEKKEEMQEKDCSKSPEVKKPSHRVSMNMLLMIFHAIKLAHTNQPALNRTILVFLLATIVNEVIGWHFGLFAGQLHEIIKDGVGPHIDPALRVFFAHFLLGLVFVGASCGALSLVRRAYALQLRRSLTSWFHQLYFERHCLTSPLIRPEIDNPDQRLSEDIEKFSEESGPVIFTLLVQPFVILFYGYKAYMMGYWIPLVVLVHVSLATLILKLPMTPMMREVVKLDQVEGDLRFAHAMAKKNAEGIAVTDGGDVHRADAQGKFMRVVQVQNRVNRLSALIDTLRWYFNYSNSFLAYAIIVLSLRFGFMTVAPESGVSGTFSQASMVVMTLLYKFSVMTDLAENVSKVNGHGLRLIELAHRLEESYEAGEGQPLLVKDTASVASSPANPNGLMRRESHSGAASASIVFDKVDLFSPDERLLVYGLSLRIWSGQNTFIHGPSGSGKSTLVKLLTGLWKPKHGSTAIMVPPSERPAVLFAPQQAILVTGSLADQLYYPEAAPPLVDEDRMLECMHAVSLDGLVERMQQRQADALNVVLSVSDWFNMMSPGEVQRLILARFLLHRPVFAVLDEATNAIEAVREEQIYNALWAAGITTITVSHRMGFVRDHATTVVALDGLGNHQIEHK